MKLANIIYEKELINHTKVDYINYFNEPKKYDDVDKLLPTLYVGWSFLKACNLDNEIIQKANILKHKIVTNELYWEFSFEESVTSHVKGIESFIGYVPSFYFGSKYEYINLDPIFFQISDADDLMYLLPCEIDSYYQYKDDMFYLLKDNKIWGINLKMYEFFQFNTENLIFRIAQRTKMSFIDLDGITYQTYYKKFPEFSELKRYVIVFLTK